MSFRKAMVAGPRQRQLGVIRPRGEGSWGDQLSHFSFEVCFSLLSFNHLDYFQDKMTKVKDIDSSSVDSKSLGETTDVLNMTHMMSLNSNEKSLKLSPIQKQKKQESIEKLKQQTAHTENDDSNEYESEEMSQKMKEGKAYKQFLAKGTFMVPTTEKLEACSDEDVGHDSGQPGPQADTNEKGLQKKTFRFKNKHSIYPFDDKEIENKSDGEGSQKDSEEGEMVSEKETKLAEMAGLKDIRKSEENIKDINRFFDELPNKVVNIDEDIEENYFVKERKRNKQDGIFDNERESIEEPYSYLEGECESQHSTTDDFELPESVECSSGEKDDDEMETDQNLWYSRKCIEQEEDTELKISEFMAKYDFKSDHLPEIPEEEEGAEDLEGSGIEEQEVEENVEIPGGKEEEEAEILSDDLTDRAEVSEGNGKSGGEADVYEGGCPGICKESNSQVEQGQSEKGEEEKDKGGGEMESQGKGENNLEEEKKQEQKERKQGHQAETNKGMEIGEGEEQGEGEGEEDEEGDKEGGQVGQGEEDREEGEGKEEEEEEGKEKEVEMKEEGEGEEREGGGEGKEEREGAKGKGEGEGEREEGEREEEGEGEAGGEEEEGEGEEGEGGGEDGEEEGE
ncbi:hypothetical protein QTO34_000002, partial [Cnephaeus nilssonii]